MTAAEEIAALRSLSQVGAAYLLGRTTRALRGTDAPRLPDGRYDATRLIEWELQRRIARKAQEAPSADDGKHWLNALRKEKALAARRENEIADGRLADVAELRGQLLQIAETFRRRCVLIERAHGPEVGDEIRLMIDQAEREWKVLTQHEEAAE